MARAVKAGGGGAGAAVQRGVDGRSEPGWVKEKMSEGNGDTRGRDALKRADSAVCG